MKPYVFEVFRGRVVDKSVTEMRFIDGPYWYWRLRASNGKIVADGSEGYASKSNAKAAVRRVFKNLIGWGVLTWRA